MIILNKKGFSLAGVLVAAGIAAGLALVIAKIGQQSSKTIKGAENARDINSVISRVERILLDSSACKRTLTSGNGLIPNLDDEKNIEAIFNKHGDIIYSDAGLKLG